MSTILTRRAALATGASIIFAANASYAATDRDLARKKLVVIVCRGGMDGLSVAPPIGDGAYEGLRRDIAIRR